MLLILLAAGIAFAGGGSAAGAPGAGLAVLHVEGDALLVGVVGAVLLVHVRGDELSAIEPPSLSGVLLVVGIHA